MRLNVTQAMNLKHKRRLIKSFKDRIAHKFNVSIAEIGSLDCHRLGEVAVVMVANDRRFIESILKKIVNAATNHRDMILTDYSIEFF